GETFPLFLLECFQAGIPVIATDIGEIPRIVGRGNGRASGVLVSHQLNVEVMTKAFATHVGELIRNNKKYEVMKKMAVKAAAQFSVSELANYYQEVFQNCLEGQA